MFGLLLVFVEQSCDFVEGLCSLGVVLVSNGVC